jgi:hypothetical protein
VEISPEKTLVSANSFEFAKRFFLNGIETTAFPLAGLIEARSSTDIVTIISEAVRRGFTERN